MLTTKTTVSFSLLVLATFTSCDAVQPPPYCKSQRNEYAARYFDPKPMGNCDGKVLEGEIFHVNDYPANRQNPSDLPKIGIEPDVVYHAVEEGAAAEKPHEGQEYALGKYTALQADANDICTAPTLSDTDVTIPEIPANPTAMPPVAGSPERKYVYKWKNFKMLVKPTSNAVHWGAELTRTEGECTVSYKVAAVWPAKWCGREADDEGEHTKGEPDQAACEPEQGSGLNPDLKYECSKELRCVPASTFPSLAKK
jgi:hypothetical protein